MAFTDAETQAAFDFDDRAGIAAHRVALTCGAQSLQISAAPAEVATILGTGMYCDECWAVDGRNHDHQFDEADAGEHYDETDAY